jgi:hypothetical protein
MGSKVVNPIDMLRDDDNYYGAYGRQWRSNSDVGILLTNPKMFGVPREDTKAMSDGRYFHKLILEPHKVHEVQHVDVTTRTTVAYKKFIEENGLKFAMLKQEKDEIERLTYVMKSNITFHDEIYKAGNKFEEPMIGEIFGVPFKCKADIVNEFTIDDLKTTSDISKFRYSAKIYNYDSQAFIYHANFGKRMRFFVIDKVTEQLGIFNVSDEFMQQGEEKVKRAIEVYKMYFGPNHLENIDDYYINLTL